MTGHRVNRRVLRPALLAACLGVIAVLAAVPFAGSALAEASPRLDSAAAPSALVPGTPCAIGTVACVALGENGFGARAWFIRDGKVVRGPVQAVTGGPGKDTPTGTFQVLSKDLHHASTETNNAEGQPSPMPYSVFFTQSGMAFHGGGEMTTRTAGCIRLANSDAAYFFENLERGSTVQVTQGSPASSDHSGGHRGGLLGGPLG